MRGLRGACLDVKDFMDNAEQEVKDTPGLPDVRVRRLRSELIREEFREMMVELDADNLGAETDLAKVGKELCDLIVVLIGTAHAYGIPLADIWDVVHLSNMSKFDENGLPYDVREDGKVKKGPYFKEALPLIQGIMDMVSEPNDG